MTYIIFIGDMLVMLFMVCVAIWFFYRENDEQIEQTANIPLVDDVQHEAQVSEPQSEAEKDRG